MNLISSLGRGGVSIALVASPIAISQAAATPGSGFAPSPIVNGHFGALSVNTADKKTGQWGLILKTLDDADIGAYSGWHAHPAPAYITVTQGTIVWYDGSDGLCTPHTYRTGDSFIEGTHKIHNVKNASDSSSAEFVAIVLKPAGFTGPAFRLDRAKPNNCNF